MFSALPYWVSYVGQREQFKNSGMLSRKLFAHYKRKVMGIVSKI